MIVCNSYNVNSIERSVSLLVVAEAIEETAKFVKPLQDDKELQRDFISELKQPHRNLMKLCNEV